MSKWIQSLRVAVLGGPVLMLGLAAATANAETWYVNGGCGNDAWSGLSPVCEPWDGPKKTIEGGMYVAQDGDVVVVADETYTGVGNKNLDFGGKAITVRSANGPDNCIIDCEGSGRGFHFQSGETASSVLEGFTLTNGNEYQGGGIRCKGSNPTITNCTITANTTYSYGFGGGVYCGSNSSPTITNCTISGNTASSRGGGVCCSSSSNPTISNCTITGNTVSDDGGAVWCDYNSSPTISNCVITGNGAGDRGGAVCCYDNSNPTISNCTIAGNTAPSGAGFYFSDSSNAAITNCTITQNAANADGGAVYCDYSSPTITNCILWGDTPEEIYVLVIPPVVTYSDIEGGWSGETNIDEDPLFVDPDGPDDDPNTWEDNDYHLADGSPCIDAGDPAGDYAGQSDLDGQMRVWDGDGNGDARVDMGSDEFASFMFGDLNCDGRVDGFDIDPFVLALLSTPPEHAEYYAEHPDCDVMLADIDGTGHVDGFDIDAFVALLVQ